MDRLLAQLAPRAVAGGDRAPRASAHRHAAGGRGVSVRGRFRPVGGTVRGRFRPAVLFLCLFVAGGCGADDRASPPAPLHHTFSSPEALGRAVLAALADNDGDRLASLALSELEFRTVVWPELPSSRPERGLPFDYAWGDLHQKSNNSLRRLVARHGGKRYELDAVTFAGETTQYDTYRVHRESVLDLRDEAGEALTLSFFGSVLERDGQFKVFSYVID